MKQSVILLFVGALPLSACGGKTDANEKNFGGAMRQYFEKKGDRCLHTKTWPAEVSDMDQRLAKALQTGLAPRMSALQAAGLVRAEEIEVDIMGIMGNPTGGKTKVTRYSLTDAAKPYTKTTEAKSFTLNGGATVQETDICWGRKALDKIIKWEGPLKLGEYQEASITYTYKVIDVAPWANKTGVQTAFPDIKSTLDGGSQKELKHGVKLTSQGWEAKGLDSIF